MDSTRRCAGLTGLVLVVSAALLITGCDGGGGDGQPANTGTITGTIVHAGTSVPLGEITVSAGGVTDTTANDGTFRLPGVNAGQYTLDIDPDPDRNLAVAPGSDLSVEVTAGGTNALGTILMVNALDLPNPPF